MHFYVPCVVVVFEAAAIFEHRLGNAALKKRPFKTEGHLLRYYAASFFIVSPEGEAYYTITIYLGLQIQFFPWEGNGVLWTSQ